MLFEDQEEQTLNSEETPLGEDESLETSETVSADVEPADSSLESVDEGQVEPESVEVSELSSTDLRRVIWNQNPRMRNKWSQSQMRSLN